MVLLKENGFVPRITFKTRKEIKPLELSVTPFWYVDAECIHTLNFSIYRRVFSPCGLKSSL